MFFYPEIRDETSRLGQRRLAQDVRIKRALVFANLLDCIAASVS